MPNRHQFWPAGVLTGRYHAHIGNANPAPWRLSMRLAQWLLVSLFLAIAPCSGALAGKANDTLIAAFPREVRTLDGNYENLRENDILGLLVDDALFAVDP